jgi:hypothetical protein
MLASSAWLRLEALPSLPFIAVMEAAMMNSTHSSLQPRWMIVNDPRQTTKNPLTCSFASDQRAFARVELTGFEPVTP